MMKLLRFFLIIYKIPFKNLITLSYKFLRAFDSNFYRKNVDSRLSSILPRFHYFFIGQRMHLSPNQTFDPVVYVNSNPRTNAIHNYPFFHFLMYSTKKTFESENKILITSTSIPLDLEAKEGLNIVLHFSNCCSTVILPSHILKQFKHIKVLTRKECHGHLNEVERRDVEVRVTQFKVVEVVAHQPLIVNIDFIINLFYKEISDLMRESQITAMFAQLSKRSVYFTALQSRIHSSFSMSLSDLLENLEERINLRLKSYSGRISNNETLTRILLISHNDSHTGAPIFLNQLAEQLISEGYNVHVLSLRRNLEGGVFSSLNEHHSYLEEYGTKLNRRLRVTPNWLLTKNGKNLLRKAVKLIDPNVILANSLCSASSVEIAQELNIPSILYVHEAWSYNYSDLTHSPILFHFLNCMEASNLVLFGSINTKLHWEKGGFAINSFTIPTYRSIKVPSLVDYRSIRDNARAKLNIDSNVKVFLSISTFEPRKRVQDIVLAFKLLTDLNTHLILVGSVPSLTQVEILSLIAPNDRITVFNSTKELSDFYAAADCFVFASEEETMPLVLQEAALHNLPRIASTYPGSSELIPSSEFAYLFSPRDVIQMAVRMNEYLESPNIAREKALRSHQLQWNLSNTGVSEVLRAMNLISDFRASVIPLEWQNEES
jgi:glycosyltransferase involved in cell wall biosynthesis